jgi:hypothetical protein
MTAGPREDERAGQAVAAGEAAAHAHEDAALAQHRISGSTVAVEAVSTADGQSVNWFGSDVTPAGVSPQPSSSPNVSDPLDNSQSQP